MVLRRIGALSAGKMVGLVYGILGLFVGSLCAVFSLVGFAFARDMGPFSALFGVGAVVALPLLYGFFGFIGGALFALLYNAFAGIIGGIELELS